MSDVLKDDTFTPGHPGEQNPHEFPSEVTNPKCIHCGIEFFGGIYQSTKTVECPERKK